VIDAKWRNPVQMKLRIATIQFIWILLLVKPLYSQQEPIRVTTFNIRYDEPRDGEDQWSERKEDVARLLRQQKPVILGIQEGLHHQVTYILDALRERMTYVGAGRDDGQQKGEYCALYIDTTIFSIAESKTLWLSETPDIPSVGWDAALPRIATCARIRHKEKGLDMWVWNTHFDHMGKEARKQSAVLLSEKARAWAGDTTPIVIMGDLNCEPHEVPYGLLQENFKDSRLSSYKPSSGPEGTFQAFGREEAKRRIDYIFVRNLNVISQQQVDLKRPGGRYPSDHFPVVTEISFLK
jgi:endonuclease/exonuclease/phosphatase family metal-dependent hydrolase